MEITNTDLANFIQNKVTLPKDKATAYGEQVYQKLINVEVKLGFLRIMQSCLRDTAIFAITYDIGKENEKKRDNI